MNFQLFLTALIAGRVGASLVPKCGDVREAYVNVERGPEGAVVVKGTRLELTCSFAVVPQATITWLHNGKIVAIHHRPTADNLLQKELLGLGTLESRYTVECATEADAGEYTCVANAPCVKPEETKPAIVIVKTAPRPVPTCNPQEAAPTITMYSAFRADYLGNPIQLVCRTQNAKEVTWQHMSYTEEGHTIIEEIDDQPGYMQLDNGDLLIYTPDRKDDTAGTFRCSARNDEGETNVDVLMIYMDKEKSTNAV